MRLAAHLFRCAQRCSPRTCQQLSSTACTSTAAEGEEAVVLVENRGPVRLIAINRPHSRNAVNTATAKSLYKAFRDFEAEPSAHTAVLYGVGGTFCAGFDLKELAGVRQDWTMEDDIRKGPAPMGPSHLELSKPLVGAVSGYAVAGGLELALLCDLRVVEDDATMGVFSRRFGVPLIDGGTVRLPALIGLSRALDLILTGRPVKAQEALAIGLANRVVPVGQGFNTAVALAEQLASFPQQCLRTDRASTLRSSLAPLNSMTQTLRQEYRAGLDVVRGEAIVGAQQFTQGKGRHGQFETLGSNS